MRFESALARGMLLRRYKRFLADVALDGGPTVTAHCPNSGSMLGLTRPGLEVWLSRSRAPGRRLAYTLEMVGADGGLVGVNTGRPNALVAEAVAGGRIEGLRGYPSIRREVFVGAEPRTPGRRSRIDLVLESAGRPACFVEVKNVHLRREADLAEFPDSVTARGAKHMDALAALAADGLRAVVFYVVQRQDCGRFRVAADIDPAYAAALGRARARGVEVLCYSCKLGHESIELDSPLALEP